MGTGFDLCNNCKEKGGDHFFDFTVSVDFSSPSVEGRYRSFWRLVSKNGKHFGPQLWVDIIVRKNESQNAQKTTKVDKESNDETKDLVKEPTSNTDRSSENEVSDLKMKQGCWACLHCTFINDQSRKKCAMCRHPK